MEKISALIDKLQELKNTNAGLQSISYYVQLLQAEIIHARNKQKKEEPSDNEQSHIAVIMPAVATMSEPAIINGYNATPTPEYKTITAQTPVEEPKPSQPAVEVIVAQRPAPVPPPPPAPLPSEPEKKPAPAMITLFPQTESPKTASNGLHKELKELNQRVAQSSTSLNERFRQGHVELGDKLGEMPVKDLRHAIGINDKFQFIQELFRGDVDTYERSIKTINEFNSLQEAEYWIERELKIRQGWEDDNSLVKQFYSLVRKRFT